MKYLARIDRMGRSLLTLNRDLEYRTLKQMLALKPTDRVFDIGSGNGFWTACFAEHCARVTALESYEYGWELARMLYPRPNAERGERQLCNA